MKPHHLTPLGGLGHGGNSGAAHEPHPPSGGGGGGGHGHSPHPPSAPHAPAHLAPLAAPTGLAAGARPAPLAPEPHRGKPNEPAHVRRVAEVLAEVRSVSVERIADTTAENAKRLFGLG